MQFKDSGEEGIASRTAGVQPGVFLLDRETSEGQDAANVGSECFGTSGRPAGPSHKLGGKEITMRVSTLGAFVLLLPLTVASAQDKGKKATLVKPVQAWEGRFDRDLPA